MMKMNYERFKRLIGKLKRGKQEYFDEFYELTKGAVYYKIKSYGSVDSAAAEDIMQETYVSFLKHIDSADENGNPLAYLLTKTLNERVNKAADDAVFKMNQQAQSLTQKVREAEKEIEKAKDEIRFESGFRKFFFWATPVLLLVQSVISVLLLLK